MPTFCARNDRERARDAKSIDLNLQPHINIVIENDHPNIEQLKFIWFPLNKLIVARKGTSYNF